MTTGPMHVRCPRCKAERDQPCVNPLTGKPRWGDMPCRERIEAATEASR